MSFMSVLEILTTFRYPSRGDKLAITQLELREVWTSGIIYWDY